MNYDFLSRTLFLLDCTAIKSIEFVSDCKCKTKSNIAKNGFENWQDSSKGLFK